MSAERVIFVVCLLLTFASAAAAGPLVWPVACDAETGCGAANGISIGYPDIDGDGTAFDCGKPGYTGHSGTDINIPSDVAGTTVVAAADGEVVWVEDGQFDRCLSTDSSDCQPGVQPLCTLPWNGTSLFCGNGACNCLWGFNAGNFVLLKHTGQPEVDLTLYAHLKSGSLAVTPGKRVRRGERLAEVGSSGNSLRPHLHFGVWRLTDGVLEPVDPWGEQCRGDSRESLWQHDPPDREDVQLVKRGRGNGTITALGEKLSCSSTCTHSFPAGSRVKLAAVAEAGSSFVHWEGGCSGTRPTCTVTAKDGISVTALFRDTAPPTITTFALTPTAGSRTVAITSLSAVDNILVTGYLLGETAAPPSVNAPGWQSSPPSSYTFTSATGTELFAWARDASGNISPHAKLSVATPSPPSLTAAKK